MQNKQQFAPYFLIQTLIQLFGKSREPSRGIRKKIDEWEKKAQEALSEVSEEHNKIAAFYALNELKEGQIVPKEAVDKLNTIYSKQSSFAMEDSRFMTEEEFDKCFPYEDNTISRGERKTLEEWAIIQEKEGKDE